MFSVCGSKQERSVHVTSESDKMELVRMPDMQQPTMDSMLLSRYSAKASTIAHRTIDLLLLTPNMA